MDDKDDLFGKLAVERGYMTAENFVEAKEMLGTIEAMGVEQGLAQLAVGKGLVTRDQAQELEGAVAFRTGQTRLVAGYEAISKLGQGGMGTVYKAKRLKDGRLVALKIIPPSLATDDLVGRFRREAGIIGGLRHANIAGCVEFGLDPKRKWHFCAMDLVEGEDMARRIARLGTIGEEEAVSMVIQIAGALGHASEGGLVHRDVKPENIMVTPEGKGKLLDLGLAREAQSEARRLAQSGLFAGSPYYASPEQGIGEVDIRSDIYSLGATLYHMVTGKRPFEGGTALAVLCKHLQEKLPWPSEVNPAVSQNLCRIIARMMAQNPDDRYQTPGGVVWDLAVHRSKGTPDVPEKVLESSTVAPPAASAAEAAEGTILFGVDVARREAPAGPELVAEGRAVAKAAMARRRQAPSDVRPAPTGVEEDDPQTRTPPRPDRVEVSTPAPMLMPGKIHEVPRKESGEEELPLSIEAAEKEIVETEEVSAAGRSGSARAALTGAERPSAAPRRRSLPAPWKLGLLAGGGVAALVLVAVILRSLGPQPSKALRSRAAKRSESGAASKIAVVENEHRAKRERIGRSRRIARVRTAFEGARKFLSDNPGRFREATVRLEALLAESEGTKLELQVRIKRELEAVRARWDEAAKVSLAKASAEAMRLAGEGDFDRALAALRATPEDLASRVALEARAESEKLSMEAWRRVHAAVTEIEERLGRGDPAGARSALEDLDRLRFSEGGAELAELLESLGTRVVRADAARAAARERRGPVRTQATSRPSQPGLLRRSRPVEPRQTGARGTSRKPSGREAFDEPRAQLVRYAHERRVNSVMFSPDGRMLVTSSADRTVRIWDVARGRQLHVLRSYGGEVLDAEFNPRGDRLVTASAGWTARIWDVRTGREMLALSGHSHELRSAAWSTDGRHIVTSSDDKTARVWSTLSWSEVRVHKRHTSWVVRAAFNSYGDRIVTVSDDRTARIWDARSGRELHRLTGHTGRICSAEFSPDETMVVTASADKTARLWHAAMGRALVTLRGHRGAVLGASFSPDGRRVLTASEDCTAMTWDARSGRPGLILKEHGEPVRTAVFSPDGRMILTASDDHTACIWDAVSGREIDVLRGPACAVTAAVWSPDGERVATASADGTVVIWGVPRVREPFGRAKPAR